MLRICLVLVIVVALAALGVSQNVAGKLTATKSELESTKSDLAARSAELQTSRSNEREARSQAENLRTQLDTTQVTLEETQARASQQQNRADDLENRLNDALRTKNELSDRLAEWVALGRTPQQIKDVMAENQRFTLDMKALSEENLVLNREVLRLNNRLAQYEGQEAKVPLPADLRGKVMAVDPKYEFVVLNIGEEDGVLERGEMLVNRMGKLVAKVRITSVSPKSSIANVLEDWKQAEIMEGDVVTVGL